MSYAICNKSIGRGVCGEVVKSRTNYRHGRKSRSRTTYTCPIHGIIYSIRILTGKRPRQKPKEVIK